MKASTAVDDVERLQLAARIREVMPDVLTAYPHAQVEVTSHGLTLRPSKPAVPKTMVGGFKLLEDRPGSL